MLSKKEIFILEVMEKVTLINNKQLTILAGKKELSTTRKAVKKLIDKGYIDSIWMGDHKVYTLTSKGLTELEKTRRPYEIKGFGSEHIEAVTSAACWMYLRSTYSIKDMFFDREEARFKLGHTPDIMIAHSCIEVELNAKSLNRLEQNFRINSQNFNQQIWLVPERLTSTQQHLRNYARRYDSKLILKTIEEMNIYIDSCDFSQNEPRMSFVLGEPSPVNNRREVMLHD